MAQEKPSTSGQARIHAILFNLTEPEQRLLSAVITAERDKLYMQRPRGINDDLWRALADIIR
jgi:hypothetical protein